MEKTFFELSATTNQSANVPMDVYQGKVVLVVNTASKCGFTPQYKGLEELHLKYKDDGLVVMAFPCDQFGHQEPGNDTEIATFCQRNFGVTFPLMAKIEVNGPGTHPIFKFLKRKAPGFLMSRIKWNFTKFLISRDGTKVKRFAPFTPPHKLERAIQGALH